MAGDAITGMEDSMGSFLDIKYLFAWGDHIAVQSLIGQTMFQNVGINGTNKLNWLVWRIWLTPLKCGPLLINWRLFLHGMSCD